MPELTVALARQALAEVRLSAEVTQAAALAGGVSNLTYRLDRQGAPPVVLRVQREQGIFEPYDVVRESRVIEALAATDVPVPAVLATAGESRALGAPFFVMEFVDAPHMGEVPRTKQVTASYMAAVVSIHAVSWRDAGLGFLDPPAAGVETSQRDLATVNERAHRYGHDGDPFIAELGHWLANHQPETHDLVFCQGDINVFNYLFRDEQVIAVVDWEQAHVGDRQSDLGLLCALTYFFGAQGHPVDLPTMSDYRALSGQELPALPYFVLAGLHKLAVIHRIWSAAGDSPPWYDWETVVEVAGRMRSIAG